MEEVAISAQVTQVHHLAPLQTFSVNFLHQIKLLVRRLRGNLGLVDQDFAELWDRRTILQPA